MRPVVVTAINLDGGDRIWRPSRLSRMGSDRRRERPEEVPAASSPRAVRTVGGLPLGVPLRWNDKPVAEEDPMKCPNDSATLVMSERSGVEIDYCPECRGVWLDRGELDKILERAQSEAAPVAAPQRPQAQQYSDRRPDFDRDRRHESQGSYQGNYRGKKKGHWLTELFD